MLKRINGPNLCKKKKHSQLKSILLRGSDLALTAVAENRSAHIQCSQYPRKGESLPRAVRLRVTYEVTDDGFITVHRVYALREGHKPVCFFNRSSGQIGQKDVWGKRGPIKVFFYLTEERLAGIIEVVGRIEDTGAIKRLTHLGPEVFPKRRSG